MNQRKIGIIISYIGQAVQILVGLIYTPVMLRLLGQNEYGIYQLVFSVVSSLSLLSLGFASSYMRFYSRYKAEKDEVGIAKNNGMFMLVFLIMSFICIVCGCVIYGNVSRIFGKGLNEAEIVLAKKLLIILVINMAMTFPNSVFNCIVIAQERFLFQKTLALCQSLLNPFITIPILILGFGSVGMVLVTTFLSLGVFVLNVYYCLHKIRAKFCFKGLQFSVLKEMWRFTFFIFLNQIVDLINWSVDKVLLGRYLGASAVAVYGIGGQINNLYLQLSTSVSGVFVPRVNRVVAEKGTDRELSILFAKVGRVQFEIMALVLTGFIFFGKAFIKFWAGNDYTESYIIALLLISPVTVPLIQNLGIEIQRAKNKHKARSIVYLFVAVANVFVSIPLIKSFGVIGAAIGTTISLMVGNVIFMNWYYYKRLEIDIIYFWKNIGSILPGVVLPCGVGVLSMLFVEYDKVMKLGVGIFVYVVIYCMSMYWFGLNEEEKNIINTLFKKGKG